MSTAETNRANRVSRIASQTQGGAVVGIRGQWVTLTVLNPPGRR